MGFLSYNTGQSIEQVVQAGEIMHLIITFGFKYLLNYIQAKVFRSLYILLLSPLFQGLHFGRFFFSWWCLLWA